MWRVLLIQEPTVDSFFSVAPLFPKKMIDQRHKNSKTSFFCFNGGLHIHITKGQGIPHHSPCQIPVNDVRMKQPNATHFQTYSPKRECLLLENLGPPLILEFLFLNFPILKLDTIRVKHGAIH